MKSISVLLIFLLCSCVTAVQAQSWSFEMWHEGKVVLVEGDTLKGLVKYDFSQDILQFTYRDQRVEAFSARKVLFFEIFDTQIHRYRQFFTLPFSQTGSYRTPIFFELLTEGKLTLLCRESLEYRTLSNGYYTSSQRLVLVNNYYFMNEKGEIVPFVGDKRDLLDKMGKHEDDVEKYIKANRLRLEDKYDFVKAVAHYNSFFAK